MWVTGLSDERVELVHAYVLCRCFLRLKSLLGNSRIAVFIWVVWNFRRLQLALTWLGMNVLVLVLSFEWYIDLIWQVLLVNSFPVSLVLNAAFENLRNSLLNCNLYNGMFLYNYIGFSNACFMFWRLVSRLLIWLSQWYWHMSEGVHVYRGTKCFWHTRTVNVQWISSSTDCIVMSCLLVDLNA
jgi:hypothetical protein